MHIFHQGREDPQGSDSLHVLLIPSPEKHSCFGIDLEPTPEGSDQVGLGGQLSLFKRASGQSAVQLGLRTTGYNSWKM